MRGPVSVGAHQRFRCLFRSPLKKSGLMDRNDCQMLTALFVAVYLRSFLRDL